MSLNSILVQTLNGLSFGALLFLLASGFTLVFGLMRIVNLAHGALYLVGGYVGIVTAVGTGNFLLALVAGAAAAAVLGLLTERVLLRKVRGMELPEVLLTVGIALVIADVALAIFGGNPQSLSPPQWLSGALDLGFIAYPRYRWFVIGLAVLVGIGLYLVQHKTRVGAIMRAGVDDREMTGMMGIDVDRVFAAMFVFGSALAGLAGVAAAGQLTMRPGADTDILLFALVVVIVGGLGSVSGAAVGSVLIGLIDSFSKVWIPEFSYFAVFAPMALVLVIRPRGLFGLRHTSEAPPPPVTEGRSLSRRTIAVLVALGLGAIFAAPYVLPPFLVSLLTLVFISGLLATSVNLLAGEVGLVSIGHAGIAAAAGYGIAWATVNGMGVGASLVVAFVLVLVVSAIFGLTTMKTKGIVYLMIALALGMVCYGLAFRLSNITGGQNGLTGIERPGPVDLWWQFYFFAGAVFVLALLFVALVRRSPFGLTLRAIRDSETRAASLGYSVAGAKFVATLLSGLLAGAAGMLAVWNAEFISPATVSFGRSAMAVVMVILGGTGTLMGPLVGAGVVVGFEHMLSSYLDRWPTLLGLVFILVVMFMPNGIIGQLKRRIRPVGDQAHQPVESFEPVP
ncbi:MAG TPA: ABC transporter permease [Acidimicrobiia bacterium]|nr:ABC transporter permease [Acidimicrobiia bacterium]